MVGYERFVSKDEEEGEFFQNSDLGYAVGGDCLGRVGVSTDVGLLKWVGE